MTQPDPIPPGQDTSDDVEQQNPSPFPDSEAYSLTKVINQVQLHDELNTALGLTVLMSVQETDPTKPISDANPATLYLSPSGQNQAKVYNAINAHLPYTAYDTPLADRRYSEIVQNVIDDNDYALSNDELQTAVRGLLLKANTVEQQAFNQVLPGGAET